MVYHRFVVMYLPLQISHLDWYSVKAEIVVFSLSRFGMWDLLVCYGFTFFTCKIYLNITTSNLIKTWGGSSTEPSQH